MSEPGDVVLTIRLKPNGQVTVDGPVQDQVLCYGLLAVAHDTIQAHAQQQRLVKPVLAGLPGKAG